MKSKAAEETDRTAADCPRYDQRFVLVRRDHPKGDAECLYAMVCEIWWRDGWARAHANRKDNLQSTEERIWSRVIRANNRLDKKITAYHKSINENAEMRDLGKDV